MSFPRKRESSHFEICQTEEKNLPDGGKNRGSGQKICQTEEKIGDRDRENLPDGKSARRRKKSGTGKTPVSSYRSRVTGFTVYGLRVFRVTSPESRITGFTGLTGYESRIPNHGFYGFDGSRVPNPESRNLRPARRSEIGRGVAKRGTRRSPSF
jgi:hypothetical protein